MNRLPALCVCLLACLPVGLVWGEERPADSMPDSRGSQPTATDWNYAPQNDYAIHSSGDLWNTMNNNGVMGNVYGSQMTELQKTAPTLYYPNYSRLQHGNMIGFWIGGILDGDTLVSTTIDENGTTEFFPDYSPFGDFRRYSNQTTSEYFYTLARAEQEYHCQYADTFYREDWVPYSRYDYRRHKPLNLVVNQSSYSWSNEYAADFIIVDYQIYNIGEDTIKEAWVGLYYDGVIWHKGEEPFVVPDEVEGYLDSVPYEFEELGYEQMDIAWATDRDGRAQAYLWTFINSPHVLGIAPLHVPRDSYRNNFNWWTNESNANWGPRKKSTELYKLRKFFGGLGAPLSDANRYYLMAKPEIDYSGFEAAVNASPYGWLGPTRQRQAIADGHEVEMVTSFGPFDLPPSRAETLTVAIAIGKDLHTNPQAWNDLFEYHSPAAFMQYLDWDNLVSSVRWAKMIYDNPGIDTDGDGDSGRAFWYQDEETGDSTWVYYTGDGVPDFRGATPPPPPNLRIYTESGRIYIRWNGYATENFIDPMTQVKDFEGYRVYLSRSEDSDEAVLLSSYDRLDYSRYRWDFTRETWENKELPFTLDSLQQIYGEDFDPLEYTQDNPLSWQDGFHFFRPVDGNQSDDLNPNGIHRVYPDAEFDPNDVDEEGRPRYWEWEYVADGLLPSVPYWVSVTAFDFGHPPRSLEALESQFETNSVQAFAVNQGEATRLDGVLDVYCYPNPYRYDGGYFAAGFENRLDDLPQEKARSIWFANLPSKCTISIYSIDGDLIRRLEHDEPDGSGLISIEHWDVISRNRESVVSGLYYWVVESEYGTQIGKLVILK